MTKGLKKVLNRTVAPFIGFLCILLTGLTLRVTVIGKEHGEHADKDSVILAFWHSRLFYMPYHFRWQKKWRILVSPSSDGDIINGILKLFGFFTVRGSTFKSPVRALLALTRELKKGASAAMIADGSRGPANTAQIGSVALAKLSGKPVLPVAFGAQKKQNLNSWDRTLLPMPFSKVTIVFGRPITVEKRCDAKELEKKRMELEMELKRVTDIADRFDL